MRGTLGRHMASLLLEIGTEELPPGSVGPVLAQLAVDTRAALVVARLTTGAVTTTGTVRRLVLMVDGVPERQQDRVTQVRGPAARIAYDPAGEPTQAAGGFARSQGVPVEALQTREVDGGRYVVAEIREAGRTALDVLGELLPGVVAGLSFSRTMRWSPDGFRFGRPIRWIVALLDRRVIPLEVGGVRAGRHTIGQRFLAPRSVSVPDAGAYRGAIRRARVVLDPDDRRRRIVEGATALARDIGGEPILDAALLDELVWSTEHPTPLLGEFDSAMAAALPRAVVLVTLQHHQKYFGVQDAAGGLLPAFIAVRDGGASHMASVRTGHEWVTRARLADAQFFLEEDRRGTFDRWNAALARVTHLAGLGTIADHVQRIQHVAAWLAEVAGANDAGRQALARAAALCKADLVTALVREFPELQGTVGGIYARQKGEPEAVAVAIEEHYWPRVAGGQVPKTLPGALLAIADRALLLAGATLTGLAPTGSQDPYGLRRAASGIIAVLLAHDFTIQTVDLLKEAATQFEYPDEARDRAFEAGSDLVVQRLRSLLMDQGIAHDTILAVMGVAPLNVVDFAARARALQRVRADPAMPRLATAYARASRILVQGKAAERVDEALLKEQAEVNLLEAWREVKREIGRHPIVQALGQLPVTGAALEQEYVSILEVLEELADPIDRFFDDVLVMAPDPAIRANRLALLRDVTNLFLLVADFSKLVEERRG
jgi:glycyl-tRNA synthetase beta chain